MKQSDLIAQAIIEMMKQTNGIAEIQRNDFAQQMGCVPSQINYVLSSRFTPEHGYYIESRRGGGGYVRITRVFVESQNGFMHIINSIGDGIDLASTRAILQNLISQNQISKQAGELIAAACGDQSLRFVPSEMKEYVRASILKQTLLKLI